MNIQVVSEERIPSSKDKQYTKTCFLDPPRQRGRAKIYAHHRWQP